MNRQHQTSQVSKGKTGTEPRTLVILTPGFPKDEEDSTCLPTQQAFVRALNKYYPGLQIVILAFEYPFSKETYLWHQNKVIPFDGWKKGKIKKSIIGISAWRALNRLRHERELLGLLSFWCGGPALIGNLFGRKYGVAHFTWILGQDARKGNRYIRWMRPRAAELVAMSDSLVEEFYRNYAVRPGHLVPNGIDPALYPAGGAERDIDVLGVGSLIPLKQYDLFLSVICELRKHLPGIRSVICGKGPEEVRLRELIREKGLEDRVILTGERSHEDVLRLMQRCRVFLHPSSYEGFSGVCLEALYAGAHVVCLRPAMTTQVEHWHIAEKWEDMAGMAMDILSDPGTDHRPVLPYSMKDSAQAMMRLFDHKEAVIS
jgi:glycosyltransferase involved in cell wall biosynthesis